jgi:hypothetical protein
MANIHYLKRSHNEAVVKIYTTESAGETIELDIANLVADGETFDANTASVTVTEIFWGAKKDKQIDVSRKDRGGSDVHGHYYLIGSGSYKYDGFVDNVYSDRNIQVLLDGPGHVLLKLTKVSGYS